MSDIARQANVSKNTVSLALRNDPQIPARTRSRIVAIAEKVGYSKNATVAHLMAELRRIRAPRYESTLAVLNANTDEKAFERHPTVPAYVSGCRERAVQLGYGLDIFWLHNSDLDGVRLNKVLKSRGIRGVLIIGLMNENRLPARFEATWREFPCVVTGVRTRDPALSFACVDHYMLAFHAFQKCLELGYRRPALVLDHVIDRLVDGRFSAGVFMAQQSIPAGKRVRPFYLVREAQDRPELFTRWLDKEKPDVILTLYNIVRHWIEERGLRVPDDIGLVQLEWRYDRPDWSGMNQHNDIAGQAALEMLVGMIHNSEIGLPEYPRATLVGSTWVNGATTKAMV